MSVGRGGKPQNVLVTLHRDGFGTPWGIRLVGGADLGTPLIVTRVQTLSPAEGHLHRGDIIKKIGEYDARDLRHEDAQNLFKHAGNSISLAVQREQQHLGGGSVNKAELGNSIPVKPPVPGAIATPFVQASSPLQNATLPRTIPQSLREPVRPSSPVVFPPPLPLTPGLLDGHHHAPPKAEVNHHVSGFGDEIDAITNQIQQQKPFSFITSSHVP